MGMLIDGKWTDRRPAEVAGHFVRPESQFRNFITADGSSGFKAEPGRYHLYIAYNCPWAHRTLIFRKLKGLEAMVSIASALPDDRAEGWRFSDAFPGGIPDTVNGFTWLHEAYSAAKPDYTGTCTVPTLWDKKTRTIVNNESSEIIRMFNSAFDGVGAKPGDYYPAALRNRPRQRIRLRAPQQRRIPDRLRGDSSELRRSGGEGLRGAGHARAAPGGPALPGRERADRGRLAPFPDACALRRRLSSR